MGAGHRGGTEVKSVQVVGGPEDGRWIALEDDAHAWVFAEPSGGIAAWYAEPDPAKAGPIPAFREVRYRVVGARAYHPGLRP